MVEAVDTGSTQNEAIERRKKMVKELYERGMRITSEKDRVKMPMLSEDKAKNEWLHQQVMENGIVTIA